MSQATDKTATWEWIGIAAAMFIVLSLPVYYFSDIKNKDDVGRSPIANQLNVTHIIRLFA